MKKHTSFTALLLAVLLFCGIFAVPADAGIFDGLDFGEPEKKPGPDEGEISSEPFDDVPETHWAYDTVIRTRSLGLMLGIEGNNFGLGQNITRAQFCALVVRLMQWEAVRPEKPSFADVPDSAWYFSDVETALKNGAVTEDLLFRPEENITREDMAVLLVRALGLASLVQNTEDYGNPFTDITGNAGFITIAYDLGIINGKAPDAFYPDAPALREEAAAMILRVHEKLRSKVDYLHAFYAINSASQGELMPYFDEVSLGWSQMELDFYGDPLLNTQKTDKNSLFIPPKYTFALNILKDASRPALLSVYMGTGRKFTLPDGTEVNACRAILTDPVRRSKAVREIIDELTRFWPAYGGNPYNGVTIDFEGMKGEEQREGLNAFLEELTSSLLMAGKTVNAAIPPAMYNTAYYDGYDYRRIGELCDKVILMAHSYHASSLPQSYMDRGYTSTPLTPFDKIYYGLRAVTDPVNGVQDRSKLAIAICYDSCHWMLRDGKVINERARSPYLSVVYDRALAYPDAKITYHERYRNPYLEYFDPETQTDNLIWYEDERSVADKILLARMFGVTGVSVWRLGTMSDFPDRDGKELYMDTFGTLLEERGIAR